MSCGAEVSDRGDCGFKKRSPIRRGVFRSIWISAVFQQQPDDLLAASPGCIRQRTDTGRVQASGQTSVPAQELLHALLVPDRRGHRHGVTSAFGEQVTRNQTLHAQMRSTRP